MRPIMILLTGGAGFIGTRMQEVLKKKHMPFVVYDLKEGHDVRNRYQLETFFRDYPIDTVIHLAALAGVRTGELHPEEYVSTNILGTRYVLEIAARHKVKHLVFFSSSSVYGNQKPPNRENQEPAPCSDYGVTKLAGEMLVKSSGVPATIVRPFTVYGEHGRRDQVIFKWLEQIRSGKPITFYGDGSTKRGYTYVGDLVEGVCVLLARGPQKACEIYNLGGGEIIKLKELADIFKKNIAGCSRTELPLPPEDIRENWADIGKAKKELGWAPGLNFYTMVKRIITEERKKNKK